MGGGSDLWPVRVAPAGPVAVGSVLWRFRKQLRVTAIVKVTFSLPEQGAMVRTNPQPIRRSDDYVSGLPSLHGASETAPRVNDAGVVIVGHAYAPGGATGRAIRVTVVRATEILIDKSLYVYGDRDRKSTTPARFEKMRVGYERAFGGIDLPANPIGVGADRRSHAAPNIIDPKNPKRGVAGFGPIPSRFLARRSLRGDLSVEAIERGIASYPDEFAWDYFQSAPNDQRLPRLRGDEWLMVEGMHPRFPRQRACLPKVRAFARVFAWQDVGAPGVIELAADMLHVEPDAERCSVVFRGSFPVAGELAADQLIVAGAATSGDEALRWPSSIEDVVQRASPAVVSSQLPGAQDDDLQDTAEKGAVIGRSAAQRVSQAAAPSVPADRESFLDQASRTMAVDRTEPGSWPPPPPPSYRAR